MLIEFEVKIKLPIINLFCLNLERIKQFANVVSSECRLTQNSHDFDNRSSKFQVMFNDTNEAVSDDCHMDLYPDCILGFAPESLDLKMLLDPLEEQLNLPPISIKQRDVRCLKIEVIRIVRKTLVKVWGIVNNTSDNAWILLFVFLLRKANTLIIEDIIFSIKKVFTIKSTMQFKLLGNTFRLSDRHHVECEFLKDTMISESVRFGKHLTIDWRFAKSEKEGSLAMRYCYISKFPETFTADELTKHKKPTNGSSETCSIYLFYHYIWQQFV